MLLIGKFISSKYSKLYSDIVILLASSYLMVKKIYSVSISGWLLNNAFHMPMVNAYVYTCGFMLFSAIFLKIAGMIYEQFSISKHSHVEPREISSCLQSMNNEIVSHLKKGGSNEKENIRLLKEQHAFDVNVRLIIDALAENIRKSISQIKVKRKDLFISLYTYEENNKTLKYELHYDAARDLIKSKSIKISDKKYKGYESVKCILSTNTTAYVLNGRDYTQGASKRYKTIKHYMGCKLEANGNVFGFLNIEFHNNSVFPDEESMQDFMEENIFPFKLLLEYQYLKNMFFNSFHDFEKNWRFA